MSGGFSSNERETEPDAAGKAAEAVPHPVCAVVAGEWNSGCAVGVYHVDLDAVADAGSGVLA